MAPRNKMATVRERLRTHLRHPDDMDADNDGEAFLGMFDDGVRQVFTWDEDDYQGSVMAVYEFEDSYFYGHARYGSCSGCDAWIDASLRSQRKLLDKHFRRLVEVDSLWKVRLDTFAHPDLRKQWTSFVQSEGCLAEYLQHQKASDEAEERERLQRLEEERRLKAEAEAEAEAARLEWERREGLSGVQELLAYFASGPASDPHWYDKQTSMIRFLRYTIRRLHDSKTAIDERLTAALRVHNISIPELRPNNFTVNV